MAREESTKSILIKLLQQVSHGVTLRIGLVPGPEAKVSAMALLVELEQADAPAVAAAVAAGADAVALPAAQGMSKWNELKKAANGKPIGLILHGDATTSSEHLKQAVDGGPDFIIAAASSAPAALLTTTGIGKIVALDESYSPQLVRSLGEMSVDAVLAEAPSGDGALTVRDLLQFRQVVDLVRRPVIVAADKRMSTEALPPLRDMGVEGLLLQVPAGTKTEELSDRVGSYRKAIDRLGRPIGRGRELGRAPSLPRAASVTAAAPEEPDEEPDDE